jgi:hypothetical protein
LALAAAKMKSETTKMRTNRDIGRPPENILYSP